MDYFLEHIADSIYKEFGENIGEHCIVFPGRRAGLFFHKNLAKHLSRPVWAPSIMTINDLFSVYSGLKPAENEILLFELYRVYRSLKENPGTFDEFYFWGDMLLDDFDDADKYLANASALFRNVTDLENIDLQFGSLTEEQIRIIKSFWTNFNPGSHTGEKTHFMGMWSILAEMYTRFREVLVEKCLAYEGMIFRDVVENEKWKNSQVKWKIYHFIGFNALNECERALMDGLKAEGKARFYWDYDNSYLSPGKINSAGYFIKDNLLRFGNDMPAGWKYSTKLSEGPGKVVRTVIESSSDVAQVKLMPGLIMELNGICEANAHETAVVLCDENLLLPVLTSLPEGMPEVNITMGYPLRQTPVYSLVKSLLELQRTKEIDNGITYYNHAEVIRILKNPLLNIIAEEGCRNIIRLINDGNLLRIPCKYFEGNDFPGEVFNPVFLPELLPVYLRDVLTAIAATTSDATDDNVKEAMPVNVRNEFIYRVVLSINRLENVSVSSDIKFTIETWSRILDRLLRTQSVPFSGEPLTGIQVMGILETRALDFKNLIILSVNEGLMPSITTASSFIPFSLRQAFGLPSINHQESIYAYHFFRLLHRAENVTFIYNSNSEGLRSGELSRFIQQMKFDKLLKPEFRNLAFSISNPASISTEVIRNQEHNDRIIARFTSQDDRKFISPSAVNTWISCRMKFYYRYVNDIHEPVKITGEIDQAMLGNFLHEIMKKLYSPFLGKTVNAADLEVLSIEANLDKLASEAISGVNGMNGSGTEAVNANIVKNVLVEYLRRILEADRRKAPFSIIGTEQPLFFHCRVGKGSKELNVKAGGYADRIDKKDGVVSIVDYKTGKSSGAINDVGDLFETDRSKDHDGWLQTMIYCEAFYNSPDKAKVRPSVYRVRNLSSDASDGLLEIKGAGMLLEDYEVIRESYMAGFKGIMDEIFTGDKPFPMTENPSLSCTWCPYKTLCRR